MDLARSSAKLFGSNVASQLLSFVGLAIFARELGAAQIGAFFLFQALLDVLVIPTDFGVGLAVEKRISEGQRAPDVLATAVVLKAALLVPTIAVILLLHKWINSYVGADIAVYLAVGIALSNAAGLTRNVLRGELRVGDTAILDVIRLSIWVGLGVALVSSGFGLYGIVYSFITGIAIMFLWGAYRCSTRIGRPSRKHARSLVDYGKYKIIGEVGWQVSNWMDVLVIGWFLTPAAVGAYEIAWRIAGVSLALNDAIATTIFPQVSSWDAEGATDRIETVVRNAVTPSLFFVIPSLFGVALLSRPILELVFGSEYGMAWLVLIVLTGGMVLRAVQSLFGRSLQGLDRPDLVARATLVMVGSNFVLNVVLVLQVGLVGAAIATLLSYVIGMGMRTVYLSRSLTIRFPYAEIGWCVVASMAMAGVVYWLRTILLLDTLPPLLVTIAVGAVVYTGVVLVSPQLRSRILEGAQRVFPSC